MLFGWTSADTGVERHRHESSNLQKTAVQRDLKFVAAATYSGTRFVDARVCH